MWEHFISIVLEIYKFRILVLRMWLVGSKDGNYRIYAYTIECLWIESNNPFEGVFL